MPKSTSTMPTERLAYFALLWALVGYFEPLEMGWAALPLNIVHLLAALAVLCRPRSVMALGALAATGFAFNFFSIDSFYTNIMMASMIHFSLCVAILYGLIRRGSSDDIYQGIAPLVRIFTVGVYAFAFLGKLNTDFLDPQYSFAAQWTAIAWMKPWSIWATLAIEGALPLMLAFRRTRPLAIIIGLLFHLVIGLAAKTSIFGFPMLMLAMYFVFLSDGEFAQLRALWGRVYDAFKRLLPAAVARYALIAVLFCWPSWTAYQYPAQADLMCLRLWLVIYPLACFSFIWAIANAGRQTAAPEGRGRYFIPQPAFLLVLTLPLFFNGFAAYLGIKGRGALSPFGNLRLLGPAHNHLLITPSMMPFKPELIKVLDSDALKFKAIANSPYLLPAPEFRVMATDIKGDFSITCIYKGETITLRKKEGVADDHILLKPVTWAERKFIRFNPVNTRKHAYKGDNA